MPEPLKYVYYKPELFEALGKELQVLYPPFEPEKFKAHFYNKAYREMELKEKMVYAAKIIHQYLPQDYLKALPLLLDASKHITGFVAITYPEFVAAFGLDYPNESLEALKHFTKLGSSEFGIRPYIQKYPQQTLKTMLEWSTDENEHVRRLASEGCRPRLPWGMALKELQKDPSHIFPILENLKNDSSEYVRRSVANNLNDISKDHPDVVLELCRRWQCTSPETDKLIKHACRTLLKQGKTEAMVLFGFASPENVEISEFKASPAKVNIEEKTELNAELKLNSTQKEKLRLEYKVHYIKANGKTSPKVFQIKEANFGPGTHKIRFTQHFQNLTTRKHYPGIHKIELVVNGKVLAETEVELQREK